MADPSPKILVIVDREQKYGDFWRVCLTAEAQEREMKEINAAAEEARLLAEAIEAERLRVEEEARKAATAVYDDSPIVAKAYESETREATFEDVAALDVVPERPLMRFQLSRPADSIGEPRVFADLSAAVWKSTSASGAPDNSSRSHFSAMTWPPWQGRAVRNRHRHAIDQASRR